MILEPVEAEGIALSAQIQANEIPNPPEQPSDDTVLKIVLQDVSRAESKMEETNLRNTWDDNNRLYSFYVPQQRWEGTPLPRSALGVPLVNEHINAILPQILDILFEESPPFYPLPHPGQEMVSAMAQTAILENELDKACVEEEMERGIFECLQNGTMLFKAYWEKKDGYMCPKLEHVELRHALVDSSLRISDARKAKFVGHRMYLTPRQLDKLRGQAGFQNIPSLDALKELGIEPKEQPVESQGEQTTQSVNLLPEFDAKKRSESSTVNPLDHPLEVLEYTNEDYVWTVLQRKIVIRKLSNKDRNKVRWFSAYFRMVPGTFYGMGISSLIGNEQRLQQGLINTMLDHLSLSLFGMFTRRRGSSITPQNASVRPGRIVDVDEAGDFEAIKLPSIDPAVFQTVSDSDSRAQRRTGANELTVQGAIPDSSGGIGRTAAGMSLLAQGAMSLTRKFVEVIERQVFVPFLEFMVDTNDEYLDKKWLQMVLSPQHFEAYTNDPNIEARSKMRFKMLAATKMKRRASMQAAVPQLTAFFQQESIQEALKGQFKTVDFDKFTWMLFDSTGWPNKTQVVRDMSQDEIMQVMSENEMLQQLAIKKAELQLEAQSKIQVEDAKASGRLVKDMTMKMMDIEMMDKQKKEETEFSKGAADATAKLDEETMEE